MPFVPTVKLAGPVFPTRRSVQLDEHTAVRRVLVLLPALLTGSPPPEIEAILVTLGEAEIDGKIVNVIGLGFVVPGFITVLLKQLSCTVVDAAQFQPVPLGVPTIVRPGGMLSVTV